MAYQVLAQKYRPQVFDDVIGQEAITRTIKNSIMRSRAANAYLFSGPRGVGKTSVARLVAKTLNCEKPAKDGPCNRCASCVEIVKGASMDVLEIDGASNRGIDEIRALRENVKFAPVRGSYKVYIIDEVHMLTPEAFNALLKTLEEPPRHVKFIFATTEAHKVLATITSRCQRFDFKRIQPPVILERLLKVAAEEKVGIDTDAALLIARSADGSMRDALVVLDQMVSFCDEKISAGDVTELLGMIHKDRIFELSDAVIAGDQKRVVRVVDGLINSGKDPVFIANSLIEHYRDLMILKTAGSPTGDMAFTADEIALMGKEHARMGLEEILYILQNLTKCLVLMKGTMNTRALLEITLMRMAGRKNILALPEILSRLEGMESPSCGAPATDRSSFAAVQEISHGDRGAKKSTSLASGEHSVVSQNNASEETAPVTTEEALARWRSVLDHVKNKKMSVFTFLNEGNLVEFSGDKVVIGFGQDKVFNKEVLESGSSLELLCEAITSVFGRTPMIEFKILEFLGRSDKNDAEAKKRRAMAKEVLKPVLEKAMDVFGGHIIGDFTKENPV